MEIIGPEEVPFNIRASIHPEILEKVRKIIADIILRGDEAVKEYTLLFDRVDLKSLRVDPKEIKKAENKISSKLKKAIRMGLENLYLFSEKQIEVLDELKELKVEVKPGGSTELLILADQTANPELVACDLIAQAEHDPLARPWLITDNQNLAEKVRAEITKQRRKMRIAEVAVRSLEKNGLIVILDSLEEAVELENRIAPEHLSLMVKNPSSIVSRLRNFGSLFIGEQTAETLGDYSSGLNHILPTNGAARYTGGLNVKDFLKFQTGLEVSKVGLKVIGPAAICLAEAEGLFGHAASIRRRLKISKAQ